jgi:hypothetical protein
MTLRIESCLPVTAAICAACIWFAIGPVLAQKRRVVDVPKEIVRQLLKTEEREFIQLRPDGSAENLVAERINLGSDGKPELWVHGIGPMICGAANCVAWIFRKTGSEYQMLLNAGSIQQVEPQKTITNGYRDIIASMHGSAWDSDLTLYKFNGRQYQRAKCFFRTYRYKDKRGRFRETRRPIITRVECGAKQ